MFGSNFFANFGIPEMQQPAALAQSPLVPTQPGGMVGAPMPAASPLGQGPLSPTAGAPQPQAAGPPAAGLGSQFGNPQV